MDSILFKAVLLNKIVNLKTPLIMSLRKIKRIINYCVLIIGFAVWGSCNSKSQHVLLPVDNVRTLSMF